MKSEVTTHPEIQSLRGFLSDQLSKEEADKINEHVENCATCLSTLDQLSNVSDEMVEMLNLVQPGFSSTFKDLSHNMAGSTAGTIVGKVDKQTPTSEYRQSDSIEFQHGSRYVLLGEIGQGGMGTVHRVFDAELQREVAIKVILESENLSRFDAARFQREARICGQLQHPGVIPIHEQGRLKDGRQFIAMKLVDGKTLSTLIDADSDSTHQKSRLLEIFSQICQTMAYAHSKGIIHRDLKPQNVMVGSFGEVQIMDWGLAKHIAGDQLASDDERSHNTDSKKFANRLDETLAGSILGTPAYMAPEQILGKPTDQRADVFALGGILYEILLGAPPFRDATWTGTFARAKDSELSRVQRELESCTADQMLKELVRDCLASDPTTRPENAMVVSDRLSEYFHQRDERLRKSELDRARSEARYQAERKRRRQVFSLVAAIASIVLLTSVATIVYWVDKSEKQKNRESKILASIVAARELQNAPTGDSQADQKKRWTDALLRLKQAEGLVDGTINKNLIRDYNMLKESIESSAADAEAKAQKFRREQRMASAVWNAIRLSKYPAGLLMQFQPQPAVMETIAGAFKNLEIVPGSDVELGAKKIHGSDIQNVLVLGLLLWREQYAQDVNKSNTEEVLWLDKLLDAVDPDEFRVELRSIARRPQPGELEKLMLDSRTYESLLSINFLSIAMAAEKEIDLRHQLMLRAHRQFPDDFEINWQLGDFYLTGKVQNPEKALRHFMVCLALQPDNPVVLLNVASANYELKDFDSAIVYSKQLVAMEPKYFQPYVNLAAAYNAKGDLDNALKHVEQAIQLQDEHFKAHYNHSVILYRLKRFGESLASINKAATLTSSKDDQRDLCLLRYRIYVRQNKPRRAWAAVNDALAAKPKDMTALRLVAQGLRMQGKLKRAIELHRQLVEYHPDEVTHYIAYAQLLLMVRQPEKAEAVARQARSRGLADPEISFIIAHSIARQGETERAKELLAEFVEQYPKHRRAKMMMADLKDGKLQPIR